MLGTDQRTTLGTMLLCIVIVVFLEVRERRAGREDGAEEGPEGHLGLKQFLAWAIRDDGDGDGDCYIVLDSSSLFTIAQTLVRSLIEAGRRLISWCFASSSLR